MFGLVFAVFCFLLVPQIGLIGFLLILASSVLIDVDHYIYFIYKRKVWNPIQIYQDSIKFKEKFLFYSKEYRNKFYGGYWFLHGVETLFVLALLGFFISKYFIYVFVGVSFHLLLDWICEPIYWDRIDKFSLIYDFIKYKKLKHIEDGN